MRALKVRSHRNMRQPRPHRAMPRSTAWRASSALALVAIAAVSCSDERTPPTPEAVAQEFPNLRLLVAQPDEYEELVGQTIELDAFLFKPDGAPAVGENVTFELMHGDSPVDNPGDAKLLASSVQVGENGRASAQFQTGSMGDVSLTLKVSNDGSEEQFIVVHVLDLPVGQLEVTVAYDGPVPVGPVDLFLMPGENRCPYNPVRSPLDPVAIDRVDRAGQKVTFGPFLEGKEFTIFARGKVTLEEGRQSLGAGGCLDVLIIPGNDTLQVTLQMLLIPLNPVGQFDVLNHFDFTDAIPGTLGDVIRNVDAFFNDTGNWLFDQMQNGIELLIESLLPGLGGLLADAINWVLDRFQPVIAGAIDGWIDSSAPDWLKDFFIVGRDLLQIVNNLEVLSLMSFDKVASDFNLAGETTWSGLALYWRLGCDEGDGPECGRNEFTMERLLDTEFPLEVIWARFAARIVPYNTLKLERHDINLQYGRLILFVLNEMILPRIADGARSLTDALLNAFDCLDLAASMTGDDGFWGVCLPQWLSGRCIGLEDDDIAGICEGAARLVGGIASDLIGGLAIDSRLSLEGECKMYEDTDDLLVDRLEQGEWNGNVRVQGDEGEDFSGDWRGCRRGRNVDVNQTFFERCPPPT